MENKRGGIPVLPQHAALPAFARPPALFKQALSEFHLSRGRESLHGLRTLPVKKPFSLFLALRYLKPKRTFVSIITLISILGVTLGITVLILVISVMRGFELELEKKVIGFDAHIVVACEAFRPWVGAANLARSDTPV